MGDSWRHILERAAANLSMELTEGVPNGAGRLTEPSRRGQRPFKPHYGSAANSRELLAQELEGLSASPPIGRRPPTNERPALRPRKDDLTRRAPQPPQPTLERGRATGAWRKLVAITFSAAVVAITAYALLNQAKIRTEAVQTAELTTAPSAGAGTNTPIVSTLSHATEEALLQRAAKELSSGDSGARSTYEFVAETGSARGAFALAETYDQAILVKHLQWGLKPNADLARKWYERAGRLGISVAHERLAAFK